MINKITLFSPFFIIIPCNIVILVFHKHYNVFDRVIASITYIMEIIIFSLYAYNSKVTTNDIDSYIITLIICMELAF